MSAENPADTVTETPSEFAKRWLQLTSKASHLKSPLCPESYHERYADLDQRDWCCDEADLAAMVEARDATLADPADRDARFIEAVAKVTPCTCSAQRSRAERAEAEVARLRATVARVLALADRLDSPYSNPSVRYMSTRIREALDGAGEQ